MGLPNKWSQNQIYSYLISFTIYQLCRYYFVNLKILISFCTIFMYKFTDIRVLDHISVYRYIVIFFLVNLYKSCWTCVPYIPDLYLNNLVLNIPPYCESFTRHIYRWYLGIINAKFMFKWNQCSIPGSYRFHPIRFMLR